VTEDEEIFIEKSSNLAAEIQKIVWAAEPKLYDCDLEANRRAIAAVIMALAGLLSQVMMLTPDAYPDFLAHVLEAISNAATDAATFRAFGDHTLPSRARH